MLQRQYEMQQTPGCRIMCSKGQLALSGDTKAVISTESVKYCHGKGSHGLLHAGPPVL